MYRNLWRHKSLVAVLIHRQFQLRYRQSLVGVSWAIIPPLAALGAASLVFHGVMGVETEAPYALVAMAALAPWSFFANSLSLGIPVVQQSQQMLTRLAFPRAALPISMVGISFVDLAVATGIFVVFSYVVGDGLPATTIWFPVPLAIQVMLVVGLVLLGSALNVFARDVRLAVPLAVQLWLFLTPVLYPLDAVPVSLRKWYLANPMTGIVETFRDILVLGRAPNPDLLVPAIIGAVAVLTLGSWYFGATQRRFADVV
jgi:lipopolysaccharide transport system permease protein